MTDRQALALAAAAILASCRALAKARGRPYRFALVELRKLVAAARSPFHGSRERAWVRLVAWRTDVDADLANGTDESRFRYYAWGLR